MIYLQPGQVRIRAFPYPYRAALTICSDRHGIEDEAQFRAFHNFLNTSKETSSGPGLDLEIGDTFWFYDDIGKFSYFKGYTNQPSGQAGLIREFLRAGYIDAIHTYGDFNDHPFQRKYAEWAVDEIVRQGIELPVWINHGNRNNIQNINRGVPFHLGANPDSPAYHMDLALRAGLVFLWHDVISFFGQDRQLGLAEYCSPALVGSSSMVRYPVKQVIKYGLATADRMCGSHLGFNERFNMNRLLVPFMVDDGSVVLEFKRFNNHPDGQWQGARVSDLDQQLHPSVLDRLVKSGGYMIIYNHLEYGDLHEPKVLARLRRLAQMHHEGKIWIATTRRLLEYNLVNTRLKFTEELIGDRGLRVTIDPVIELPSGKSLTLRPRNLEGFCFEVPNRFSPVIFVGDEELPMTCLARESNYSLYGTSWKRLEYPDSV